MFYLAYMASELRRRRGRTLLTALGLGVGVALVVAVSALSTGLDRAQAKVLEPLTGVGTDLSVTRPLTVRGGGGFVGPGGAGLSQKEQDQLREENGVARFGLRDLGEPGEEFTNTNFISTSQLSFPATEVAQIAALDGVGDAAGGLSLNAITVSGTVPEQSQLPQGRPGQPPAPGQDPGPPRDIDFDARSITGVDASKPALGAVTPGQVTRGEYFSAGTEREAILNVAYARRKGLKVGETFKLDDRTYTVIGLAQAPLGGSASDVYVKLDQLQALSGRKGRVNTVQVRATGTAAVAGVEAGVKRTLEGASVTTAQDLADRVGGSLVDAKNLSGKLGTALTIVGLVGAFLIAALLTLSSVTKRVRELGTLKAIGWPQRLVVRQVTGESLLQGALGGVIGVALGLGAAALIGAVAPTLEASVASTTPPAGGPGAPGGGPGGGPRALLLGFGQGQITSGSTNVTLDAPVDLTLVAVAAGLALLGGLIAGTAGGLRAARLRPAAALRHID